MPSASALGQAAPDGGFDPKVIEEMAATVRQVPLTEDMVKRLIASHPEMRAAAAKFSETDGKDTPSADAMGSDLDSMTAEKRKALEAIATKHGFKTLDEWADVASSVAMSYAYALAGKKPGALAEAVRLNIAQAEREPAMSEEQKQQTIAQYRELGEKLAKLEPLKENFELVVRMKEQVTSIMDPG